MPTLHRPLKNHLSRRIFLHYCSRDEWIGNYNKRLKQIQKRYTQTTDTVTSKRVNLGPKNRVMVEPPFQARNSSLQLSSSRKHSRISLLRNCQQSSKSGVRLIGSLFQNKTDHGPRQIVRKNPRAGLRTTSRRRSRSRVCCSALVFQKFQEI